MKTAALNFNGKTHIVNVNSVSAKAGIIRYDVSFKDGSRKVFQNSEITSFTYLMS